MCMEAGSCVTIKLSILYWFVQHTTLMADQRKTLPPPVHPQSKQQGASVSHNNDIIKPRVSRLPS